MIIYRRTTSKDKDFVLLVKELDAQLAEKNGEAQDFYGQFNKLDAIKHVVLAFDGEVAVGYGAVKQFTSDGMEVKRMFTKSDYRGQGIALSILKELENWTIEVGFSKCVLETDKDNVSTIQLYKKNKYQQIPNYGQYKGVVMSVCFEKEL